MNNLKEVKRRFKEAQACLAAAEKIFLLGDFRPTVQNAQTCIELCAKAIIAYFAEPEWTHDPSVQLFRIIEKEEEKLKDKFKERFLSKLYLMLKDVKEAAPWHA